MAPAIPLIDVSGLGIEETATQRVAAAIGAACRDIGFFYVVDHGVPQALIDAAFAASRRFFAAPGAVKETVSIKRSPHNRGYVGPKVESLDPSKLPDLKEAFNIGLDLAPDDPEIRAGVPFRGVNLWPDQPGFRETMTAYYDAVWALGRRLHEAVALDLGLEPSSSRASSTARWRSCASCTIRAGPTRRRRASSAPASTPTMATSRCSTPTTPAGSKCVRARANGSPRRSFPAPSSAISATA